MQNEFEELNSDKYRYWLERKLPPDCTKRPPGAVATWIMLNPSTATSEVDDPTIRRIKGFSQRGGYTRMIVVNLFPLRATDPNVLRTHPDPFDILNDHNRNAWNAAVDAAEASRGLIVCAWGSNGGLRQAARNFLAHFPNTPMWHLGLCANGHPKHPLYLPKESAIRFWPEADRSKL